ncbi:hypothetical protein [Actinoplanes aureus]|uniref:Uncharacterized protein n=1 Tax=Actinoplanes aureus TaxID=2792083 RepID=A0A931CJ59_9ACTN|nr:hypothetical protein [Actinoplanes aureus]MBG0568642.1 hypothetical protein [Actinoplanes aureus]
MRELLRHVKRRRSQLWPLAGIAVLLATALAALYVFDTGYSGRGDVVDRGSSADGHYQVQVFHWESVIGEDGWDIVIQDRDGLRNVNTYAGCLFSEESGDYAGIRSVEAGSVRIATDNGPLDIAFDPTTMHVTKRIPAALCQGYE